MSKLRLCPRCNHQLPEESFGWRDAAHTRRQSYCEACENAAWRSWYDDAENHSRHLRLVAERRRRRIKRHQQVIRNLKSQPCSDCGRTFPPHAMDFDHLGEKEANISSLVYSAGTDRLMRELAKCEVVCAVCHRIRTQSRLRSATAQDRQK